LPDARYAWNFAGTVKEKIVSSIRDIIKTSLPSNHLEYQKMSTGYKSKYEKSKFLRFLCAESGLYICQKHTSFSTVIIINIQGILLFYIKTLLRLFALLNSVRSIYLGRLYQN